MKFVKCRNKDVQQLLGSELLYYVNGIYYVNHSAVNHLGLNKVLTVRHNTVLMEV